MILRHTLYLLSLLALSGIAAASGLGEAAAIPHVGDRAREGYLNYQYAYQHKAFAIAPGGGWAWRADAPSAAEAQAAALAGCAGNTRRKCALYAVDNQVVFDVERWPTLWGPYPTAEEAAKQPQGSKPGERFYDLTFRDPQGRRGQLSDFSGKVVLVHFWGSWCSPCLRELPQLEKLWLELEKQRPGKVEMVLLQAREPFSKSQEWVSQKALHRLPLYDSGVAGEGDHMFTLSDGSKIADRQLAAVFPSSYVIDGNGVTLFRKQGAVERWLEYLPFILNAVGD